ALRPCSTLFPYTTLFRSQTRNMTCPASDCRSKGIFSFLLLNPRPPLNNKQCCLSRSSPKKLFPLPPFRKQHVKTGERWKEKQGRDRKSTRLNSSHVKISY